MERLSVGVSVSHGKRKVYLHHPDTYRNARSLNSAPNRGLDLSLPLTARYRNISLPGRQADKLGQPKP